MQDNSASNKRIAKNSIILSIRMLIILLLSLYTTRAVLNVLGVIDYGIYNVVCGFVALFGFLNTSMSNGIQRFFNFELGKNGVDGANNVYCTSLYIQVILAIIIILLTESVGLWYLHNKMVIPDDRLFSAKWIFHFSIMSFVMVIMQVPYTAAVMAHERMDYYAIVSVFDAILKLIIVFLLPYITIDNLIAYGLLMMSISIINFLLYYIYCKLNFKEIRFTFRRDKGLFCSMLGFSGWNLFGTLSQVAQEQGISLVLNFFFGPIINAARSVAFQINAGLQSFVGNITIPVRPQVVQSYAQGNIGRTMNLTYSISKLSCCFFVMMAIPIIMEIDFVLHIWLGDSIPLYTSLFTIWALITALTNNLNSAVSNVVHATGIMKDYQLWGGLIKISSVPVACILLRFFYYPEIVLVCLWFLNLLSHIVGLFILKKILLFSIVDYIKKVIFPIFIVIIIDVFCSFPIIALFEQSWYRFLLIVMTGIISACLSIYFIVLDISERSLIKSQIKVLYIKIFNIGIS